jgi:hypothetical protein
VATPICCTVNATTPISVCESQKLAFSASGTVGGSYVWTGPSSFSSTQQNPFITKVLPSQGGIYQVSLVYGGCTTTSKAVTITVNPKPGSKSIVHE